MVKYVVCTFILHSFNSDENWQYFSFKKMDPKIRHLHLFTNVNLML